MNFHNMFTIQFGFDKGSDIIPTIRSNLLFNCQHSLIRSQNTRRNAEVTVKRLRFMIKSCISSYEPI